MGRVRITLVLDVTIDPPAEHAPSDALRNAAREADIRQCDEKDAVAVEDVNAYDIVGMLYSGVIMASETLAESKIEDI